MTRTRVFSWYALSLIIIAADQITKYLAVKNLDYSQPLSIVSFLNLRLLHNSGAAFSFLASSGGWQVFGFSALAIIVAVFLGIWLWRLPNTAKFTACALALILGGAIGNVIDRIRFGYVVDFVDFHIKGWHFATFNIADAAISIGVLLLLCSTLFKRA